MNSSAAPTGVAGEFPGNLFVVAAPSGAGKSSLVNSLLAADAQIQASVSHTTRAPRGSERDGREYHFVSAQMFDAMVERGEFIEWAQVHGHRYGTSRGTIEERIAHGGDVILEIDFQGALQIKKAFANAVLIFILPPSWQELRARLVQRAEDRPDVIELRLGNARQEIARAREFDFVIINEVFDIALADLRAVVRAQRLRFSAQRRARGETFKALNIF